MRHFDIQNEAARIATPRISELIAKLNANAPMNGFVSSKTKSQLEEADDDVLAQSAASILSMSGMDATLGRIHAFVNGAAPATDDEKRAYDYLCELATVRAQYASTHLSPGVILLLHRASYRTLLGGDAGHWREDGAFAGEIPEIMRAMCDDYRISTRNGSCEPLLASLIFFCDFNALAPVSVGSVEMSWLLLELLLLKNGYEFARYTSIESEVAKDASTFAEYLNESIAEWAEGTNDYGIFVEYMLEIMVKCVENAGETAEAEQPPANDKELTSEETIELFFATVTEGVSKQQILDAHPTMTKHEVDKIIAKLRRNGVVEMVGAGRKTRYRKTFQSTIGR